MQRFLLWAGCALSCLVASNAAHAGLSCNKIGQSEFDERFKKETAAPGAVVVDEGDVIRAVVVEEKPDSLSRSVIVFSKPGHPLHPLVLQRWIFEDRRFYITKNKGWTGGDEHACVEALKGLISDEGGHETSDVSLVEGH